MTVSPRQAALRVVSLLSVVLGMFASVLTARSLLADPERYTATATVTEVQPGHTQRRVYEVTFVTHDGQRCSSTVDTGAFSQPVAQPTVGDAVQVRYQVGSQPCALVREAADRTSVVAYVAPFAFTLVGLVLVYVSWFRWPRRSPAIRRLSLFRGRVRDVR